MIFPKTNPFVSVIIPVYNGERFISQAIDCVFEQNYSPLEIIVIDDGSTDNTYKIVCQYKDTIRYVKQKNQGPAVARNEGIKISQGEIIAFLDVDDLWTKNKLNQQISYLKKHPSVDIVQGLIQQMEWEKETAKTSILKFKISSPAYQFLNLGSAIYRKSVFDRVGLFDETLWDNEDTDWYIRAWKENINKVVLPEVMMYYRLHDRNMVLNQKDLIYFGLPKILKKHMDIARKMGGLCHLKGKLPPLWAYLGKTPVKNPLSVAQAQEKLRKFKQKLDLNRKINPK